MKSLLTYKDNNFGAVKDIDVKNRVVTGYLSTFDNIDRDNDVVLKGAFSKTLNERRGEIFFLNQHNFAQPHGKFSVLKEDSKGLYFESEPLIDTTYSNDAIKLYEAGIIEQHSIGFITIDKELKSGTRCLKELKLYEGSNVTIPSNDQAEFTGFKSMTLEDTNAKIGQIMKFFKKGTVTDGTFVLLELALKDLQKHAFELGKKTLIASQGPSNDTLETNKPYIDIINNFSKKSTN